MDSGLQGRCERPALLVGLKKEVGVIALKIFAQVKLVVKANIADVIRYSMWLPLGAAVLGMPKFEYIDENVAVAKAFAKMSKPEMKDMSGKLSKQYKAGLDRFFENHVDA